MTDLFTHAEAIARSAARDAEYRALRDSPAERRRRRDFCLAFAESLREEARDGERRGWPDYAARWHGFAEEEEAKARAEEAALMEMGEAVE